MDSFVVDGWMYSRGRWVELAVAIGSDSARVERNSFGARDCEPSTRVVVRWGLGGAVKRRRTILWIKFKSSLTAGQDRRAGLYRLHRGTDRAKEAKRYRNSTKVQHHTRSTQGQQDTGKRTEYEQVHDKAHKAQRAHQQHAVNQAEFRVPAPSQSSSSARPSRPVSAGRDCRTDGTARTCRRSCPRCAG